MKKLMIVVMAGALGLAGCQSSGPEATLPANVENVAVAVAQGRTLKEAVVTAATRRRWMPSELGDATIRCTLVQRSHRVVVDVHRLDANHYSIRMVESNIPARKLAQWVNNLRREIARHAARP